jgi:hypothetical protein
MIFHFNIRIKQSGLQTQIHLSKIPRHFGAKLPKLILLKQLLPYISRSGLTHTLYYLRMFQNVNKLLRNLISLRQHVLLLYLNQNETRSYLFTKNSKLQWCQTAKT